MIKTIKIRATDYRGASRTGRSCKFEIHYLRKYRTEKKQSHPSEAKSLKETMHRNCLLCAQCDGITLLLK